MVNNKTILIYDASGSYTFMAERFAQDFRSVKYFTQWMSGFSSPVDFLPGIGLDGVERIQDIYDVYDDIDVAFFCDVVAGGLQERMRKDGIPVFGCGAAQVLEIDRYYLKQKLMEAGMPTAKFRMVKGVAELRKVLQKEKDLFVKMSYFRAAMETFHHKDWFASETWLDNLSLNLGPYGKITDFLIEEPIEGEAVEVGWDTYAVDGVCPENICWGYECKDQAFVMTTDPLPARLQENVNKWSEILEEYQYRGIFSTEVRVTKSEDYLIDATMRCPSPPSEIHCANIENLSEIVFEGANGRLIEPVYRARYGAMLVLKSNWIVEHPLPIKFSNRDRVFVHGHFVIDGRSYAVVPEEFSEWGGAVGLGDTLEDAIGEAIEVAESIEAHQLQFDIDSLNDAMESIKQGNELGIEWIQTKKAKAA